MYYIIYNRILKNIKCNLMLYSLTSRLKIGLKDIVDSQYTDQVGDLEPNTLLHFQVLRLWLKLGNCQLNAAFVFHHYTETF